MTDDELIVAHLTPQLGVEEEERALPYDDATGKTLRKGDVIQGFISIGVGINLSAGLDPEEIDWLLARRIRKTMSTLARFDWYASQDAVRKTALVDLAFNLGPLGLLHWPHFLGHILAHDYAQATAEIVGNQIWTKQVGPRAPRIESMIATGKWPADIHTEAT